MDAIMSDIKATPHCSDTDTKNILTLINTVERAHRDLINLEREQEINNATIVSMIEERFKGNGLGKLLVMTEKQYQGTSSRLYSSYSYISERG